MRVKKECLILTFPTTVAAMQWEKYCIVHGIPGRIIPVPREITAGCGLAWKTEPEEEGKLWKVAEEQGMKVEEMRVLWV